jgi:hypothetical protein
MHNTTIKVIITDKGEILRPASPQDLSKLKLFHTSLKAGTEIEAYLQIATNPDKTNGQLAKAHALFKELSNSTGHTIEEIKHIVKERAGLYDEASSDFKSFADCSKQDMSNVIEHCIALGNELGIYLY